jgi:hypothetical protein
VCVYCWLGNELTEQVKITGKLTLILSDLQAYSTTWFSSCLFVGSSHELCNQNDEGLLLQNKDKNGLLLLKHSVAPQFETRLLLENIVTQQ